MFEQIQKQIEDLTKIRKQYKIENGSYTTYEPHYYELSKRIENLYKELEKLDQE